MSHLPIPIAVLYAGLGGTVLALIVATVTNRWSPRVFFLLALWLAIGWHFLFEGLHLSLKFHIARACRQQHANTPHTVSLLCTQASRQHRRCNA